MKSLLYGALMLSLAGAPALAQDAATAPASFAGAKLQTDVAKLLTDDFVRSSIYIGYGKLTERKTGDDVYLTFERENYTRLKGADDTRFVGFLAPDAARAFLGQEVLVFARFDGAAKRGVIGAVAPASDANVARVKELIAANPTLEISVTTSKPQYALGEPIVVKWMIKNVSGAPLSIFTGEFAARVNLNYDGGSHSFSDENARKRPAFVRLAPNESWEYERVFDKEFPVGLVGIDYYYRSGDALEGRKAAPDDLFLESKTGEFSVEVVAPTGERRAQLLQQLKSPVWTEQLEAAKLVLQSGNVADIEKLESFAGHPDARLRAVAAQAILSNGVFTPALKQLLYQGSAVDEHKLRERGDYELALLALWAVKQEAVERQIITAEQLRIDYFPILSLHDARIGEILAARLQSDEPMQGGLNNGIALNWVLELRDSVKDSKLPLPDDLKEKTLAAWKQKRGAIKNPFTPAQLQAEIALARQIRTDDYQKGPSYDEVVSIINDARPAPSGAGYNRDAINKRILALPAAAIPTLFQVYKWRGIESPPVSALERLAASEMPDKFVRLAQVAYGRNDGDARVAAIGLMADLDFERTRPHLEAWLAQAPELTDWNQDAPRLGAALVLAKRGEKRAVPVFFAAPYRRSLTFMRGTGAVESLQKITGLDFKSLQQWSQWWEESGSKMEWK